MEFRSQEFKYVAEQCAFRTQSETLGEVKTLKARDKKGQRIIMQQFAHSHSEANLRHLNTIGLIKAESESLAQLRADQAEMEALMKTHFDRPEIEMRKFWTVEMKKLVKKFLAAMDASILEPMIVGVPQSSMSHD